MIPSNISRLHVLRALKRIDREGVPTGRNGTQYVLEYRRRQYPPKLAISIANEYANGSLLASAVFGGGKEANSFLHRLGFRTGMVRRAEARPRSVRRSQGDRHQGKGHSGQRCRACKARVRELLEALYGSVSTSRRLELGTRLESYREAPCYDDLEIIWSDLVAHRGFSELARTARLPPCDFFVERPRFIVEFDESQHFTVPRALALRRYPRTLALGFDSIRWQDLCGRIDARDHDPPFRDEQRAWYDTLRDFAPCLLGLHPTVRLFADAAEWCRLDPSDAADVERFRKMLGVEPSEPRIQVRAEPDARMARVVISRPWPGKQSDARALLETVARHWPVGARVDFLLTCGGFVQFPLVKDAPDPAIASPSRPMLMEILGRAKEEAGEVVPRDLRARLSEHARYITLGIDTRKCRISTTMNRITEPHAETVVLMDLATGQCHATAKSYPTPAQQRGLIRCEDLESHFVHTENGQSVMVLGCHDLSIFNPRSANARGWRARLNARFRKLAREWQPVIALHHPHTADCTMTWRAAWAGLERRLPTVKAYAGAGRFWRDGGPRSQLEDVLTKTKRGPTIDFIVE